LPAAKRQRDEAQRGLAMTFHLDGEEDRLFPFDLVSRVVVAEDWEFLPGGLTQRVRALEAFLRDDYGDRAAVRDGVVPAWAVDDSPGLHRPGTGCHPGSYAAPSRASTWSGTARAAGSCWTSGAAALTRPPGRRRERTLRLASAPGNGVADDKALYAFVSRLVEDYLGERPLLANVPTYFCWDPEQRGQQG
jgi:uncharacterized circularly permuted ATP-grasp superfamily protein